MIYTIGYTDSYEQGFKDQERMEKIGREPDYKGGVVWQSIDEATANCPPKYTVYGVLADWNIDTSPGDGPLDFHGYTLNNFRYLIKTSPLVKI